MSGRRKNQSEFSYKLDNLTSELAKISVRTAEIAAESFQPIRTHNREGHRLPKREWRDKAEQHAFGVSETLALALKLSVSPWDLVEKRKHHDSV
jgi:hypothetical protein